MPPTLIKSARPRIHSLVGIWSLFWPPGFMRRPLSVAPASGAVDLHTSSDPFRRRLPPRSCDCKRMTKERQKMVASACLECWLQQCADPLCLPPASFARSQRSPSRLRQLYEHYYISPASLRPAHWLATSLPVAVACFVQESASWPSCSMP